MENQERYSVRRFKGCTSQKHRAHSQLKPADDIKALTRIDIVRDIKSQTYIIRYLLAAIHCPLYLVLISGCVGEGHEPVARVAGTGTIGANAHVF